VSDVLSQQIPDWYVTAFDAASAEIAWTDRTGPEVDRVAKILQPRGDERILDMACGSGRHSLELRRRGFNVTGADISPDLIDACMEIPSVYHGSGRPWEPKPGQFEIFVEARKTGR
jgi:SAM-dependent methyltransferase